MANHKDEEVLSGGNSTQVRRVGTNVHRTAGSWTPRVHELLRTLRAAGVTQVPEVFGIDDQGSEVVSYLPGDVAHYPLPDWLWNPEVLGEAAELLRRIHDASAPLASVREGWQNPVHDPAEVICHNDFAPYNLVFTDGHVTGAIDFDTASPGPRAWDFCYLAYRLAPFATDAGPDAPDDSIRLERLGTLSKAYCGQDDFGFTVADLLTTMAALLGELAEFTEQRAKETGAKKFLDHAAMYRSDSADVLQRATSVGDGTRFPN